MSRVINFSAGPAALPLPVLEQVQSELLDWQNHGVSIMEIGHRTPEFTQLAQQIEQDLRELLSIPDDYAVLFHSGGARVQFAMLPLNILSGKTTADYIDTGYWSQFAIKEAKKYCTPNTVTQSSEDSPWHIPSRDTWQLNTDAAYLHYTDNETISGIQFHDIPEVEVPLICDATSSLLTKEIDITKYGAIYAGAQKNLGVAGMCMMIIRRDLIGNAHPMTPSVYDYQVIADTQSFYVTPPTFPWYVCGLILQWIKREGGLSEMDARNQRKAKMLYDCIDNSNYYKNHVAGDCRSQVNITFRLPSPALETEFLNEARTQGLAYLKGHKSAGGIRASIYNAISESDVQRLCDFMGGFCKR